MAKDELVKIGTILPSLPEKLRDAINEPTPKAEIKHRQARGGLVVRYVTLTYMVKRLNELFGHLWDFSILEQQVGKTQVWVKGELKIWLSPTFSITKTAFGGSDIKFYANTENIIDIADDLKSASADSLKKCASLLGIASDIYGKVEEKTGEGL
jgi:hypothetical protein